MKNLIIPILLIISLSSCSSNGELPLTPLKGTSVEDLIDRPNRDLLRKSPPKAYLENGTKNGEAAVVISNNNLRALAIENRLDNLQQYVCNLFKDPAGEVCIKDK